MITKADEAIARHEALRDAILLLKLASQAEDDLETGRFLPQQQALARIRKRLTLVEEKAKNTRKGAGRK